MYDPVYTIIHIVITSILYTLEPCLNYHHPFSTSIHFILNMFSSRDHFNFPSFISICWWTFALVTMQGHVDLAFLFQFDHEIAQGARLSIC